MQEVTLIRMPLGMSGIPEYYVDNLNQKDVYECIIRELTDVLLVQING